MNIPDVLLSTLVNLVLLAAIPFGIYVLVQRRRGRTIAECARRAGLAIGETKYIGYCAVAGLLVTTGLIIWPPSLETSVAEGSAFGEFAGLGLGATSIVAGLLYSVVKTGFAEEFLFRGMIAGSLSRRLSIGAANVVQALIFLAPHVLILFVDAALWTILPIVFGGALFAGWVRIRSGSILGPWLLHALVNFTTAMSVAIRSA